MLKQLLEEAKVIEASYELDDIFESVDLSPEVKEGFKLVYEQSVRVNAAKLAEAHVNGVITEAEARVEKLVQERASAMEDKLYEDTEKYFNHITAEWMNENKRAVDNDIKANMFDSLVMGMKEVFVEHNIIVPEVGIDVMQEMEDDLEETKDELRSIFEAKLDVEKELNEVKRNYAINEATADMTFSQKERVVSLVEGMDYSENFTDKLQTIISVMSVQHEPTITEAVVEAAGEPIETVINSTESELNYTVETTENPMMASYMTAAYKIK